MFRSPKGHAWTCENAECLAAVDKWVDAVGDADEINHCATPACHGVVWIERGFQCDACRHWYCNLCWQLSAYAGDPNNDKCQACNIAAGTALESEDEE